MPIANCFIKDKQISQQELQELAEKWASEVKVDVKDVCLTFVPDCIRGGQHMGNDPTDSLGIWFLKAESAEQKKRVGDQTSGQPTMVIYTTELDSLYQKLKANEVRIKVEPVHTPEYSFLHCYDLYGMRLWWWRSKRRMKESKEAD